MKYAASSDYLLEAPVSEFVNGGFSNPTSLSVETAATLADSGVDSAVWVSASWRTDGTTDPDTYFVQYTLGPTGDHQLAAGRWMRYVRVDGEVYELGLIEIY